VPATISLYNHTSKLLLERGIGDTYKVRLVSSGSFDATHTTLAGTGATEVANGNGYTTGGATLANITVSTVSTNDAKWDADDVTWNASGGTIEAIGAQIYNDTVTDDPPLAWIDFGETKTAAAGTPFQIAWDAAGIFSGVVA
jgi:hypothetical protein